MALRLEDKKAIVTHITAEAKKAISVVAADYRGLTVAELTELRAKARASGVYLKVVRNTLARRALQDTEFACLNEALIGPLFLAFSETEPGAAAKVIRDFAKDHEKLEVKALSLGGKLLGPETLDAIAKLPNKEQALAILLAVMKAPIDKFVRTVAAPHAKLVRTIAAVRDQKQAA